MNRIKTAVLAASLLALAAPAVASAQPGSGDRPFSGYGGYGDRDRGDYDHRPAFQGFPEFAAEKFHIRQEIRQGRYQGWLRDWSAERLSDGLRRIEDQERREFQEHGWHLPGGDRARIRASLDQLDRAVDRARDERRYGD